MAALAGAAAIVAVEALLVAPGRLLAAQIVDALLVLALVNAGPRRETQASSPRTLAAIGALRALALVPLVRVMALGLPMSDWTEPPAVLAVTLPLGLVAFWLAPVVRLRLRRMFSLSVGLADLYAISAGLTLGLLAFVAGAPRLWPDGADDERIALGLAAAAVAAFVEELVFRGLIQSTLQAAVGRVGIVAAMVLFAATHLDAGSTVLVLTIALAGVAFSHAFANTGRLPGVILGHVVFVVGAGAVWPSLVETSDLPPFHDLRATVALAIAIAIAVVLACWQRPVNCVALRESG
ncbi:MAG: CPBP family intramembrane metalloprotease [Chloroflexota bacterium]|nr:CPBP family intramembrane metalloprotease [Chloroflexota bacterium]